MEISQPDVSLSSEQGRKAAYLQFQKQLEDRLNQLKADLTERPFLWLAIAFFAGVVSHTFPVRILFHDMLKLRARAVSRIYHSGRRKWLVASAPSRI